MTMFTNYLVYYVEKEHNEQGMASCGLYKVVQIEIKENETRIERERKAIEEWVNEIDCEYLDIELERVIYGVPVWSMTNVTDEGQDNDEYYIAVQHLPNEISR